MWVEGGTESRLGKASEYFHQPRGRYHRVELFEDATSLRLATMVMNVQLMT